MDHSPMKVLFVFTGSELLSSWRSKSVVVVVVPWLSVDEPSPGAVPGNGFYSLLLSPPPIH